VSFHQVAEGDAEELVAVEREHRAALAALRRREAQPAAAPQGSRLTHGDDLGAEPSELRFEQRFCARSAGEDHARDADVGELRDLVRREWKTVDGDERLRASFGCITETLGFAAGEDQRFHYSEVSGSRSGVSGNTSVGETARPMPS
jgi:hypothetical protein